MRTLYPEHHRPMDKVRYLALAHDPEQFRKWCKRWDLDSEAILYATTDDVSDKVRFLIKEIDDLHVILLDQWNERKNTFPDFLPDIFSRAAGIHPVSLYIGNLNTPVALAGYIINWKLPPKQ